MKQPELSQVQSYNDPEVNFEIFENYLKKSVF